jgi:hypothetical protein
LSYGLKGSWGLAPAWRPRLALENGVRGLAIHLDGRKAALDVPEHNPVRHFCHVRKGDMHSLSQLRASLGHIWCLLPHQEYRRELPRTKVCFDAWAAFTLDISRSSSELKLDR